MESKHTKGILKQEHRIIDNDGMYSTEVFTEDTVICQMEWVGEKIGNTTYSRREDNAKRLVKCWNMHDELIEGLKYIDNKIYILEHTNNGVRFDLVTDLIKARNKVQELIKKATEQ